MSNIKQINYTNRDFDTILEALINNAKIYFPTAYKNFNLSSTGMMMFENVAYIGDVLNYVLDYNFKEIFADSATERKNVIKHAEQRGYLYEGKSPSIADVNITIEVPADESDPTIPDEEYAVKILKGMEITADDKNGTIFRLVEDVDFAQTGSWQNKERIQKISQYTDEETGTASYFKLTKQARFISGEEKTYNYSVTSPEEFLHIKLPYPDVTEIISTTDTSGDYWYEVDYLAEDKKIFEIENSYDNDPDSYPDSEDIPYLLKFRRIPKRFIKRIDSDGFTTLVFGSGIYQSSNDEIIPSPINLALGKTYGEQAFGNEFINPADFAKLDTLGLAPQNTTLSITYRIGGGKNSNVDANILTIPSNASFETLTTTYNPQTMYAVQSSIETTNLEPSSGGSDEDSLIGIKEKSRYTFGAQGRAVTIDDFIARCYNMPSKFGKIFRVGILSGRTFASKLNKGTIYSTDLINYRIETKRSARIIVDEETLRPQYEYDNPLAVRIYILSTDTDGHVCTPSTTLKKNLLTYLKRYRMISDSIELLDGNIVNIGLNVDILVTKSYNKNDVMADVLLSLKDYFNIDKWQMNQAVIISDIYKEILSIEGVQGVASINLTNKHGGEYSSIIYNIKENLRNGILLPNQTAFVECKFPNKDIRVRSL